MSTTESLAPTEEAIDTYLAQNRPGTRAANEEHWGVDIRTKAGRWRSVTSSVTHPGARWYWTIRGEGSSNGCRETCIRAADVVAARGHNHPAWEYGNAAPGPSAT